MACNTTNFDGNFTFFTEIKEGRAMTKVVTSAMAKVATSAIIVACLGSIWNFIAITMLYRCKRMTYQIKAIAINLALTDFITGVYTTVDAILAVYGFHDKYESCVVRCHIGVTLSLTSISFITLFAFDGFFCLKFAMKYYRLVTEIRVNVISFATWLVSFTVTATAFVGGFKRTHACVCFDNRGNGMPSMIYRNICYSSILVLYAYIFWHVRQQNRQLSALGNQQSKNIRPAVKIAAIVGIVFIMYFPKNIILIYSMLSGTLIHDNINIFTPFAYLEKLNGIVNPLLYVWRFRECRMYVIKTFCWCSENLMKKADSIYYEICGSFVLATDKMTNVNVIYTKEIQNTNTENVNSIIRSASNISGLTQKNSSAKIPIHIASSVHIPTE